MTTRCTSVGLMLGGTKRESERTMKVVRCNSCGKWIGWENELDVVQTDAKDEEGEYIDYESCPICGSGNGLMDLDTGCSFDESEVSVLRGLFEQMELSEEQLTEEKFLDFAPGTHVSVVRRWFEMQMNGEGTMLTTF